MKPDKIAPKQTNPCPVIGYIKSGQVLFQVEGHQKKILKTGDAFYEPKNTTILHFNNLSEKDDLIFIAFYLN